MPAPPEIQMYRELRRGYWREAKRLQREVLDLRDELDRERRRVPRRCPSCDEPIVSIAVVSRDVAVVAPCDCTVSTAPLEGRESI